MMEQHNEMMRAIGRLEGKVDGINQRLDKVNGNIAIHEKQINENTAWRNQMVGRISIIVGIVGAGVSLLVTFLMKKF